ncbi:expressed unknown protein [Seminavis robusta]|uniref:Uncharacterized protein n=1 Tax=Seminavis robusta TaxID=568900 RepID=A0A9N8DRI1_9STRA|nr:expressed unknown protein [Seminavis robusta]|eukprot:Sro288_g108810.1 n/a (1658) ;mRNA; f:40919-45892
MEARYRRRVLSRLQRQTAEKIVYTELSDDVGGEHNNNNNNNNDSLNNNNDHNHNDQQCVDVTLSPSKGEKENSAPTPTSVSSPLRAMYRMTLGVGSQRTGFQNLDRDSGDQRGASPLRKIKTPTTPLSETPSHRFQNDFITPSSPLLGQAQSSNSESQGSRDAFHNISDVFKAALEAEFTKTDFQDPYANAMASEPRRGLHRRRGRSRSRSRSRSLSQSRFGSTDESSELPPRIGRRRVRDGSPGNRHPSPTIMKKQTRSPSPHRPPTPNLYIRVQQQQQQQQDQQQRSGGDPAPFDEKESRRRAERDRILRLMNGLDALLVDTPRNANSGGGTPSNIQRPPKSSTPTPTNTATATATAQVKAASVQERAKIKSLMHGLDQLLVDTPTNAARAKNSSPFQESPNVRSRPPLSSSNTNNKDRNPIHHQQQHVAINSFAPGSIHTGTTNTLSTGTSTSSTSTSSDEDGVPPPATIRTKTTDVSALTSRGTVSVLSTDTEDDTQHSRQSYSSASTQGTDVTENQHLSITTMDQLLAPSSTISSNGILSRTTDSGIEMRLNELTPRSQVSLLIQKSSSGSVVGIGGEFLRRPKTNKTKSRSIRGSFEHQITPKRSGGSSLLEEALREQEEDFLQQDMLRETQQNPLHPIASLNHIDQRLASKQSSVSTLTMNTMEQQQEQQQGNGDFAEISELPCQQVLSEITTMTTQKSCDDTVTSSQQDASEDRMPNKVFPRIDEEVAMTQTAQPREQVSKSSDDLSLGQRPSPSKEGTDNHQTLRRNPSDEQPHSDASLHLEVFYDAISEPDLPNKEDSESEDNNGGEVNKDEPGAKEMVNPGLVGQDHVVQTQHVDMPKPLPSPDDTRDQGQQQQLEQEISTEVSPPTVTKDEESSEEEQSQENDVVEVPCPVATNASSSTETYGSLHQQKNLGENSLPSTSDEGPSTDPKEPQSISSGESNVQPVAAEETASNSVSSNPPIPEKETLNSYPSVKARIKALSDTPVQASPDFKSLSHEHLSNHDSAQSSTPSKSLHSSSLASVDGQRESSAADIHSRSSTADTQEAMSVTVAGSSSGNATGAPEQGPASASIEVHSHASQSHTCQSHASQSHASQSHASQSYASQSHVSQSHASQSHASQSHASQSHASQSHASQSHTSQSHNHQSQSYVSQGPEHVSMQHSSHSLPSHPQNGAAGPNSSLEQANTATNAALAFSCGLEQNFHQPGSVSHILPPGYIDHDPKDANHSVPNQGNPNAAHLYHGHPGYGLQAIHHQSGAQGTIQHASGAHHHPYSNAQHYFIGQGHVPELHPTHHNHQHLIGNTGHADHNHAGSGHPAVGVTMAPVLPPPRHYKPNIPPRPTSSTTTTMPYQHAAADGTSHLGHVHSALNNTRLEIGTMPPSSHPRKVLARSIESQEAQFHHGTNEIVDKSLASTPVAKTKHSRYHRGGKFHDDPVLSSVSSGMNHQPDNTSRRPQKEWETSTKSKELPPRESTRRSQRRTLKESRTPDETPRSQNRSRHSERRRSSAEDDVTVAQTTVTNGSDYIGGTTYSSCQSSYEDDDDDDERTSVGGAFAQNVMGMFEGLKFPSFTNCVTSTKGVIENMALGAERACLKSSDVPDNEKKSDGNSRRGGRRRSRSHRSQRKHDPDDESSLVQHKQQQEPDGVKKF